MATSVAAWDLLATDVGTTLVNGLGPAPEAAEIQRARINHDPEIVRLAIELAAVRSRASVKWPESLAAQILADREGFEMASSWHAARHKAVRFQQHPSTADSEVLDLCAGIGGDTLGLLSLGLNVLAVDRDPCRNQMNQHNAALLAEPAGTLRIRAGDVAADSLPTGSLFHLDPARRSGGSRLMRYEDLVPGPEIIERLTEKHLGGAIKLNPGIQADLLPHGELEIFSEQGRLTQAVLWTGELAPDVADAPRRATRLDRNGSPTTIAGLPERTDEISPLQDWLYTLDPAVERADLLPTLQASVRMAHVHPGLGLLSHAEELSPEHPHASLLQPFRVLEDLPWQPKAVRKALSGLDAGLVEVKTRSQVVNPDQEQARLRGKGRRMLTVFVLRFGSKRRAIIAERPDPASGEAVAPKQLGLDA